MTRSKVEQPPCVLVAEQDSDAREFLADNLACDGYRAVSADSPEQALAVLAGEPVDAVLVEAGAQTLDVIDAICTADGVAGRPDPGVALIALTARAQDLHRVRLLERGCDDVLEKPYSYIELRARLAAVTHRARVRRAPTLLRAGQLTVNVNARTAHAAGVAVELTCEEYELLRVLAADPGRVFTRAELLDEVWGTYGLTRSLDSTACRLRRKLADAGQAGRIENVWGVGYRLGLPATSAAGVRS